MKVFLNLYILYNFMLRNTLSLHTIMSKYATGITPVLLFPGLGASRLVKKNIDVWPPKLSYFLFNYNKWSKEMTITYDQVNNKFSYDTDIKTFEFGDVNSLDLHKNIPFIVKQNVYNDIIGNLDNIFPIPYDFRLIHNENYITEFHHKLNNYIESFDKPVTFITHSSGGLMAHYFLSLKSNKWKKKYIKDIININVPFTGTLVALKEIIYPSIIYYLLNKNIIKSFGSVILNLPNKKYTKSILTVDGIKNVDYITYFNLSKLEYLNNKNKNIIDSFSKSTNVKTTIVYTSNIKTPETITVKKGKINIINGLGDGTVGISSLLHPLNWNKKNIKFLNLPHYEHSSILHSKELLNFLRLEVQN